MFLLLSALICVIPLIFLSCSSKPSDLRTLVPAETLVFLETNDLAAALQPIIDSKPFTEAAKSKPDFSALKGVQLAVAVTGFETTEEKLTDENSVGRVQPRFVAVADTHAWNYQAVAFADQKLGQFVTDIYGADVTQETTDKNEGKYFVWTSNDGRKAFAQVVGSLIYFGNDESAIEKCLAVKRGEADSIVKPGKVKPREPSDLASGYVSTDGVAQIASIIGLKLANEIGEDSEVQSAIAGIVPQLLRNSVTDVGWTAVKTEKGFEDKFLISMPTDVAKVFSETMMAGDRVAIDLLSPLPAEVATLTLYNFKDPQIAWRSLILVAQKLLDPLTGTITREFSSLLFEPYGIRDPELFLSASAKNPMGRGIVTTKLDRENDETIVIAVSGDDRIMIKSLNQELRPPLTFIEGGTNIWSTPDDELQVIFNTATIKIGSKQSLARISDITATGLEDIRNKALREIAATKVPVTTVTRDFDLSGQIADILASKINAEAQSVSMSVTETRFTKTGMERRTISDFGLIGAIIGQLGGDQ